MSKDNSGHSSVSAELEVPTKEAELRIILVDPTGQRPTQVWSSGSLAKYRETIQGKILRRIRLRIRRIRRRMMIRTTK